VPVEVAERGGDDQCEANICWRRKSAHTSQTGPGVDDDNETDDVERVDGQAGLGRPRVRCLELSTAERGCAQARQPKIRMCAGGTPLGRNELDMDRRPPGRQNQVTTLRRRQGTNARQNVTNNRVVDLRSSVAA